jgi:hypothetical protein
LTEQPTRFTSNATPQKSETAPQQTVSGSRIEFNSGNIRKLIEGRGIDCQWEKSWLCTCRNPRTLAPDSSCPICHGKGVAYLPAVTLRVVIQSQEKGVTNGDLGLYDSGTAIATTQIDSSIGYRDRLSVPDVTLRQSVIFDVTQRRVDNGMYLTYDVKSLDLVMGANGQQLVEGADYRFEQSTNKIYVDAKHIGTIVSINMQTVLRYFVIDFLKESRYQYTEMNRGADNPLFENYPKKLLLKREDIFVNPEPFSLADDTTAKSQDLLGEKGSSEVNTTPTYTDVKTVRTSGGFFNGALND